MAKTSENLNTEISSKYGSCTPNECFINEIIRDNDVLQCRKCQRFVHYACSELPAYQVQICLQYKARRFECAKCITVTPILLEKFKTSKQRTTNNKATNTGGKEKDQDEQCVFARLDRLEKKIDDIVNKDDVVKGSKQQQTYASIAKDELKKKDHDIESKQQQTYASITKDELKKQEVTIKNFIKEEKEEERWLNLTKYNIIVHNLGENKHEDLEEQRVGDKDYVEEVVQNQMGLKVNIVSAERIGARKDEMFKTKRWRPLKVVLKNEEEKRHILASVHKLEKDEFRVSDDFSKKERETIKEWHRKAKEKTELQKDGSWIYKVRGSPRTKLYFKKIYNKPVTENEIL